MSRLGFHTSVLLVLAVCMATKPSIAQQQEFEVASVRQFQGPHVPHGVSLIVSHGRAKVDAGSLRQLLAIAYGVQRTAVEGGPDWSDSDEFNIAAKAEKEDASYGEIQGMLQILLAERFKLTLHPETKEMKAYVMLVDKNGFRLQPIAANAPAPKSQAQAGRGDRRHAADRQPRRGRAALDGRPMGSA